MNNNTVRGYKVTDSNMQCRGFQYELGKVYQHEGYISLCNRGFHFCEKANDCFNYYDFDSKNRVFEVVASGNVKVEGDKSVTDKIEFVRELSWIEVLNEVNTGKDNTGRGNTGDWNTGNRNTGYRNTGDWNTGYRNTGYRNTGYRNTGDWNTGDWNTGYRNTGYRNTGYRNTGDWNTGDWNTGDWNTGYSNTGNRNTGVFCTGLETLPFFNKPSTWTESDFFRSRAYEVLQCLETKMWVWSENMTDKEKEVNPQHSTTGGYLKDIPVKEAWVNLWGNLNDTDKNSFKELPNFDAEIFESITGVKIGG